MKKWGFVKLVLMSFWLVALVSLFHQTTTAAPFTIESEDEVIIDEEVNAALIVSGDSIRVEENVNGVTIISGGTITIDGDIDGTVLIAGQTITINGAVNGTVFVAGQNISTNGTITGDLFTAGQSITLEEESQIEGSVFTAGQSIVASGTIAGDLFVGADSLQLSNTVGRDAVLAAERIHPTEEALIEGDLIYTASQQHSDVEEITQGEVQFQRERMTAERETVPVIPGWWRVISGIGTLISVSLIWWFLRRITNGRFATLSRVGTSQVFVNILIGLAMVVLLPVIIFLTFLSLILSRVAGLILLLFIALFLLAQIVTASAFSEYIVRPRWAWVADKPYVSFIFTFFVLYLINNIPVIGWFIAMLSVFYAMGLVFVEIWDRLTQREPVI